MLGAGGAPGKRAPDDAKDLASHRGEFRLPPCISGLRMHYPQPTHKYAKSRCRVRAEVTPGNAEGRRARESEGQGGGG